MGVSRIKTYYKKLKFSYSVIKTIDKFFYKSYPITYI